ncbi:MAG: hypothetical protein ACRCZF_06155, partial [Gemmataceae bacterium]
FVLPLAVDQAAACVRPAMAAANEPERTVAFTALRDAINPLADAPTGVGLDVPVWLRRLEDEARKSRGMPDPDDFPDAALDWLLPQIPLDFEELRAQLRDWDKPLAE